MGEALVTKQRTLAKIDECLQATNAAVSTVDDLRTQHNALGSYATTQIEGLTARVDAIVQLNEHLRKQVGAFRRDVDEMLMARVNYHEARSAAKSVLLDMTCWQRVRFLLGLNPWL